MDYSKKLIEKRNQEYIELTTGGLLTKLAGTLKLCADANKRAEAWRKLAIRRGKQYSDYRSSTRELSRDNEKLKNDYIREKIRADRLEKQLEQVNDNLREMLDFSTPADDTINRSTVKHG